MNGHELRRKLKIVLVESDLHTDDHLPWLNNAVTCLLKELKKNHLVIKSTKKRRLYKK